MLNSHKALLLQELDRTKGIFRLAPTWVPRANSIPGRRLKLHPHDLYPFGQLRGGITERWLASTVKADNGPLTPADEGLSYVVILQSSGLQKILLRDAIDSIGEQMVGESAMNKLGGWAVLCKFFDNLGPIPFHLHQRDEHAKLVRKIGKAEAYYFPPQLNLIENRFPYSFLGLHPLATKEDIRRALERWDLGDNEILQYSQAYRIVPGTGWDVPTGILHAPGSLVTYEPQRPVDIGAMYQSLVNDVHLPKEVLTGDVPQDRHADLDFLVELIDWPANQDPEFVRKHFRPRLPVRTAQLMNQAGVEEYWVTYDNPYFSAKELTIAPNRTVTISDDEAYGMVLVQGHGTMQGMSIETPAVIRYGQMTMDEFFVTKNRANQGVTIANTSDVEPLVILKHFGPKP